MPLSLEGSDLEYGDEQAGPRMGGVWVVHGMVSGMGCCFGLVM